MTSLMIILICGAIGALIACGLAWRSIRQFRAGANSTDFAERVATQVVSSAWESRGLYGTEIFFATVFGAAAGGFIGFCVVAFLLKGGL